MAKLKAEVAEEEVLLTPEQIKTINENINTSLVKNNITDSIIAKYKKEYLELKINGVEDKDGYTKVYDARQTAKRTRILIVDICKAGRAPKKAEVDAWIAKQNELVAEVKTIESYLQGEEDAYESAKEEIKKEKIRQQTERLKGRVAIIQGFGAMWDGSHYTLDEVSYSQDILRETEDDFFNNKIVPQYKAIYEAKEKIRIANKEAQDLLEAQQRKIAEDLKEQQAELARQQEQYKKEAEALEQAKKDQQDAIDRENARIEKEKQQAHTALVEKRSQQLLDLGFTYDFRNKIFTFKSELPTSLQILDESDNDKWDEFVKELSSPIESIKKRLKDEADAEQERLNKIAIDNATAERERLAEEQRKKEREELEEGNDLDRWLYFVKSLPKEYPVMSSRQYKTMIDTAKASIENIKTMKATRK